MRLTVADLRRAAFHGSPRIVGPAPSDPESLWLRGVCSGATGRYAQALACLAAIPADAAWASLGWSAAASLTRQVGRHAQAEELDRQALAVATDAEAVADARVGMAADRVGVGDAVGAREHLAAAAEVCGCGWRAWVRHRWVAAEVCLLESEPQEAADLAREAAARSAEALAPRHLAKSLRILGVASATSGDRAAATASLGRSLSMAADLGVWTLVWPGAQVLGPLLPPTEARRVRAVGAVATAAIAAGLPPAWRDSAGGPTG